jgi:solute carrier family 25 protein 39/40
MQIPATALYYTAYDELKERLVEEGRRAGPSAPLIAYAPLISGVISRAGAVTVVAPLELLRTRAMHRRQVGEGGLLLTLRGELASGGLPALWRGWGSTLWRDVPFSGIYWLGYERVREAVAPSVGAALGGPGAVAAAASSFVAGLAAGTVAALVTTPFDVVKTRRQVKLYEEVAAASAGERASALPPASTPSLLRLIAEQEGMRGLFAGVGMRVARVGPSCAIMIATYELGKALFLSHGH